MPVNITEIEKDQEYMVNTKTVYKDTNDKWIATQELTPTERNTFFNYLKAINNKQHCRIKHN